MTEVGRVRRHVVALLVAVALLAAAIAVGVLWNRPPDDLEGEWQASTVQRDGQDVLLIGAVDVSTTATLTVREESGHLVASATAGCNDHRTTLTYRLGGTIDLGEWVSTLRGCLDGVPDVESALIDALSEVDHVDVDHDELTLTGGGVEMSFTRFTA